MLVTKKWHLIVFIVNNLGKEKLMDDTNGDRNFNFYLVLYDSKTLLHISNGHYQLDTSTINTKGRYSL